MREVSEALDLACPTLRDVAEWLDVPYETVRAWKAGKRSPWPAQRRALRAALERHAKHLQRAAHLVYREGARPPTKRR